MTSLTRGPLPAGVYWRRRVLALGLALTLVFVIASLLSMGSDGSSDDGVARQANAAPELSGGEPSRSPSATRSAKARKNKPSQAPSTTAPVLAEPTGACVDGDVLVTPLIEDAVAASEVMIVLQLRTLTAEACTWRVSSSHVTLKISSGDDDIWSSLECPAAVPVQDVVVRRTVTATIGVVWNSKRSDDTCSDRTEWAYPGYYHVAAAALGGEPSDVQFELQEVTPDVITESPKPDRDTKGHKRTKGMRAR